MSEIPDDLRYTDQHEWVRGPSAEGTVRVGLTDYAQAALGDIVYVSLPDVGAAVAAGQVCGEVESTKSVSEVFAPVSGTVTARNDALDGAPETVNSEPYDGGWLFEVQIEDSVELEPLLDASAYASVTEES